MTALLILFTTAIIVLYAGLAKNRQILQPIALVGTLGALGVTVLEIFNTDMRGLWYETLDSMVRFDGFAHAFSAVVILSTALIIALSRYGFRQLDATLGDNYGLLLFSLCGALCLFSFNNITMLFLGIEILSIPLYVLAGSKRENLASNEAALKYFLMGSFATGIFLFGSALIFGSTGSFSLDAIHAAILNGTPSRGMLTVGILLIVVGMSFKVSAVPFHFWAPDVYTGSPNLVTAFMATVVKTAGFAAFFRLFSVAFPDVESIWGAPLAAVAALTMTVANLTALFQTDFKRMMAYSSISHAGYLMLAVLAIGTAGADRAMLFYTLSYSVATICAFGAYIAIAEPSNDGSFSAFSGLSKRQPLLAAVLAIAMLSLAGIPPTAGFFGKYFLFTAAFAKYPILIILAVINSAISIYYYFKIIIAMYFAKEEGYDTGTVHSSVTWVAVVAMVLIALMTAMPGTVYGLIR